MSIIRSNTSYKVKLEDFEGPLDLLLHVIRDSKMDIKTVPLASVTSQYLEFLSELDTLDLNLASEFIEVGATLIEIKSKQILPKEKAEDEEDPDDLEARLRAQLEEYKLFKEQSEKLKNMENVNRFYKPAEQMKEIVKYNLDNLNMDLLTAAFIKIMHKVDKEADPIDTRTVRKERFTVRDKMEDIRGMLANGGTFSFFGLFDNDYSRVEVLNTFLAVLELLKTGEIMVEQCDKFGDIIITKGLQEKGEIHESGDEYNVVDGYSD